MGKPEEKKEEEVKFPLGFNKCPVCGSTRGVVNSVVEREKAKGKVGKEKRLGLALVALVWDMSKVVLEYPIIMVAAEMCADCGALYGGQALEMKGTPPGPGQNVPGGMKPF